MKIKVLKTATRATETVTYCPYMIDLPADMGK